MKNPKKYLDEIDQLKLDYNRNIKQVTTFLFYNYILIGFAGFLGIFILAILDLIFVGNILFLGLVFFYMIILFYLSQSMVAVVEGNSDMIIYGLSFIMIIMAYYRDASIEFALIIYTLAFINIRNIKLIMRRINRIEGDWYLRIDDLFDVNYGRNINRYIEDRIKWIHSTTLITGIVFVILFTITKLITNNIIFMFIETFALILFIIILVPQFFKIPKAKVEFDLEKSKANETKKTLIENI
jgi:hypothetical protein